MLQVRFRSRRKELWIRSERSVGSWKGSVVADMVSCGGYGACV
jgi:hypothetical protein